MIIFSSCEPSNQQEIQLFNGITFLLRANEKQVELRSTDHEYFNELVDASEVQIPLFRRIEAPTHTMFIGLPVGTSLDELSTLLSYNPNDSVAASYTSASFLHTENYNPSDSSFTVQHVRALDENLVFILVRAKETAAVQNIFPPDSIAQRFKIQ